MHEAWKEEALSAEQQEAGDHDDESRTPATVTTADTEEETGVGTGRRVPGQSECRTRGTHVSEPSSLSDCYRVQCRGAQEPSGAHATQTPIHLCDCATLGLRMRPYVRAYLATRGPRLLDCIDLFPTPDECAPAHLLMGTSDHFRPLHNLGKHRAGGRKSKSKSNSRCPVTDIDLRRAVPGVERESQLYIPLEICAPPAPGLAWPVGTYQEPQQEGVCARPSLARARAHAILQPEA